MYFFIKPVTFSGNLLKREIALSCPTNKVEGETVNSASIISNSFLGPHKYIAPYFMRCIVRTIP